MRQAVRLPPAEAMRPEPPAEFRPSLLERLGLTHLVSISIRMALRNLERRPWQALFTGLGLALATGIPVVPGTMKEGINYLLSFQWDVAQRQDVTVALQRARIGRGAFRDAALAGSAARGTVPSGAGAPQVWPPLPEARDQRRLTGRHPQPPA